MLETLKLWHKQYWGIAGLLPLICAMYVGGRLFSIFGEGKITRFINFLLKLTIIGMGCFLAALCEVPVIMWNACFYRTNLSLYKLIGFEEKIRKSKTGRK